MKCSCHFKSQFLSSIKSEWPRENPHKIQFCLTIACSKYINHLNNFNLIEEIHHNLILLKITCKMFKLLVMKTRMIILMLVTMMIQLLIKIYPVSNQKLSLLNPCHLGPVIQGFYLFHIQFLKRWLC